MTSAYTKQLGLQVQKTNIRAQKINNSLPKTFRMVIAGLPMKYRLSSAWFFEESFLLANINMKMILRMFFLILNNAYIQFVEKEHTFSFYTSAEALSASKQIELINKKEFTTIVLDEES